MKKMFLLLMVFLGFSLFVSAQADQCKFINSDGYIDAYVSNNQAMAYSSPSIYIATTPSVAQASDGKVLCKITYIRLADGQEETITRSLEFKKSSSFENLVGLDSKASRILSIKVWGAECFSASR